MGRCEVGQILGCSSWCACRRFESPKHLRPASDRSGTLSAVDSSRQTSRLRSCVGVRRAVAGPRCSTLAARYRSHAIRSPRPLPSPVFQTFLPCSLVTAPRVAFVVPLLMPIARSSLCSLRVPGWKKYARHIVRVDCSILLAAMVSGDFRLLWVGQILGFSKSFGSRPASLRSVELLERAKLSRLQLSMAITQHP